MKAAQRKTRAISIIVKVIYGFLWCSLIFWAGFFAMPAQAGQVTGFFEYEVDSGGMYKQCVYRTIYGNMSINVSVVSICPITYTFNY